MQMRQGANDAPFARSATSFGAADIIGRGPTSFAAKPQLRSFVPQAAMQMSQGTNDAPFTRSATSFGAADIIWRKPTSFAAKPQLRSSVPQAAMQMSQGANDAVPHMAMQMSQGTNDAPFARSATSFGAADIIGREPTSFAAKPQLRSFVPQAAMQMSQDANDVACVTQTMLCLAAQMKNPKAYAFGFLVGEAGFGPAKSVTTDLQSAPFGRSGIPPGAGDRS